MRVPVEYKSVVKQFWIIIAIIALSRFTAGAVFFALALVGAVAATRNKMGVTMLCYMYIPLLTQINPSLMGGGGWSAMASRLGTVILTGVVLLQAANRTGKHSLPLGLLYIYFICATVSSINGWCPVISYLKVANIVIFVIGIHLGTKNLNKYPQEVKLLRDGLLAFSCFLVFGSIFSYFVPSIGYSYVVRKAESFGAVGTADDILANAMQGGGMMLFAGVTKHPQTLSGMLIAVFTWVLLDMILVERRVEKLHMAIVVAMPFLMYLTHSRLALLGMTFDIVLATMYLLPKAKMAMKWKNKIKSFFYAFIVVAVVGAMVSEARNATMTKWLRKTSDISTDTRDITEAVTSSRMGLIDENMYDFHKNPTWGMGFQTTEAHAILYQAGRISIYSAPIEKGVWPTMILGETGVIGLSVFLLFLLAFYATCARKRYIGTIMGMTMMLVINMGEAGIFSPGGMGGSIWIICVVGGFAVDMAALANRQRENAFMVMR